MVPSTSLKQVRGPICALKTYAVTSPGTQAQLLSLQKPRERTFPDLVCVFAFQLCSAIDPVRCALKSCVDTLPW